MSVAEQQKNTFESFMDSVCDVINPAEFNTWFSKVSGCEADGKIKLSAPNQFVASTLKNKYMETLSSLASEMQLGMEISNSVVSAPAAFINDNAPAVKNTPAFVVDETDDFSFDNFITDAQNEFAVAACKKLGAANVGFSPLFLYGDAGCGKTHLARAVKNAVIKSERRVVMLSGDRFASDFIRSLKNNSAFAFKDKILNADVLIVDGVESLTGKRACLSEFESLLVGVIENGGNVVLTARQTPSALSGFDKRLQSVLSSGITADISAPNSNAKTSILKLAGANSDVADFVAANSENDGHIIAGIAKKISVWQETFGMKMTLFEAQRVLADSLCRKNSPENFVSKMCEVIGVCTDEIKSNRRTAKIVRNRQMMMNVLKSETNLSLAEIGKLFGNKDHATVLYGINHIEKLRSSDLTTNAELELLRAACR